MDEYFKAAQHGDLEYFKTLNANDEGKPTWTLNTQYDKSGDTVLHIAARCGHLTLLQYLIDSGADIETSNLDGKRPLHEAAQAGQTGCVECLLKAGAQVDSLKRADWLDSLDACLHQRQ
ncbi:ankyrin repeat domain-containing protein 16-like isoform X2 [Saccostrea cucullata]|uniref:ankyrin repeat domain-containing protein 16-like isoform X2 n=1 Tax=Saccostrea cuccullata TaxID=36930 RepID=UPI002ED1934C